VPMNAVASDRGVVHQWADRAGGLIVDRDFDPASADPGQGRAQDRFTFGSVGEIECDGPWCAIRPIGTWALGVVPVGFPVALADYEVHVVGKFLGIFVVKTPMPIVVAMFEFRARAVRHPDLPELFAEALRGPGELAEIDVLARLEGDLRLGKLPEHAV